MSVGTRRQNIIILFLKEQFPFLGYINGNRTFTLDSHRPFICSVGVPERIREKNRLCPLHTTPFNGWRHFLNIVWTENLWQPSHMRKSWVFSYKRVRETCYPIWEKDGFSVTGVVRKTCYPILQRAGFSVTGLVGAMLSPHIRKGGGAGL